LSTSSENTIELAEEIGRKLRGGEIIELVSDLGGGKTTFVRGLAQGMGSTDSVHSPSFTISNEYTVRELTLHHFDFHRLNQPGIMRDELVELLDDPKIVIAIEWADIVEDVLPTEKLTVKINATGENERKITFDYPENLSYLVAKS